MSTDLVELHFRITSKGSHYSVSLQCGDGPAIEETWRIENLQGTEFLNNLRAIRENICNWHHVNYVGGQLWLGLTPARLGQHFASRHEGVAPPGGEHEYGGPDFLIRLEIPDECRSFPWESLHDRRISSLGLAEEPRYCVVHHPPAEARIAAYEPCDGSKLSMLILAPENTQLDVSREINAIREIAAKRGITPVEMRTRVTATEIYRKLRNGRWDIVHYVGHGEVNAQGRLDIVLNAGDGTCVREDAEHLCSSFQTANVRLAVFNCCRGDGDHHDPNVVSGLGPMLMRMGVPAVITMRYEIADYLASAFARHFYEALFDGDAAGRVDIAVRDARAALSRANDGNLRSYIAPILHLAPLYHRLFDFETAAAVDPAIESLAQPLDASPPLEIIIRRPPLDPTLREAIRSDRCVAVVGPGILQAGITRRASAAPPGPLDLINLFTTPPLTYPRPQDLEHCKPGKPGCDWMQSLVLQWVCEHHAQLERWEDVADKVCKQYHGREVPEMVRAFADIRFSAMFYTWFDGFFHDLVSRNRSWLNQVLSVSARPSMEGVNQARDSRPLVLVRGSVQNPDSLVITESDHEGLAVNIAGLTPELTALTHNKRRCSVLFVGVSPREPLVRQLCQKLLFRRIANRRTQGPTFFLCPDEQSTDRPYWAPYDTQWICSDLDPFLNDLIEASR